jgi:hypothetical protein
VRHWRRHRRSSSGRGPRAQSRHDASHLLQTICDHAEMGPMARRPKPLRPRRRSDWKKALRDSRHSGMRLLAQARNP